MTTFTASEVRYEATQLPDSNGRVEVAAMLRAYADLLEADEKAQPVAYAEFTDGGCIRMWSRQYEERLPGTRMIPPYTHPTPADAERLAEALERTARHRAAADRIDPDQWRSVLYSWEDRALASHSAQAQPPASSVPDGFVLVQREPTEAMVDAVCKIKLARLEALRTGHGATSGIVTAIREEWEAMLAAQENHNG